MLVCALPMGGIIVHLDNLKVEVPVVQYGARMTAEVVVVQQAKARDLNGASL
jgi:hypothetical protein